MNDLTIWGRRSSFNVQKVLWTLGELGLLYEHRDAGGSYGGLDTPEFLAMNPHGRVPVLRDRSLLLWESNSIVRYLAASYGNGSLWPILPGERSFADRWIDWSATALQPDFMKLFWGYYRTPEKQRNQPVLDAALAACTRHYRALNCHLEKQAFLAGNSFTMGDIPAGTSLYRYFNMGLSVEHPPNVMAWYERLQDRVAFQQHVMIPFDDLYGRVVH
jgi:glutathione S-transferase